MKSIAAKLTESTTQTYGDLTKTFLAGRVRQGTILGKPVVGPGLTTFADVQTAFGITPGHCIFNPATGRKFELQNLTTNTPTVLAFNFDEATGAWTFIGKIVMTLPAGTHTYRGFDFDDSDTNNIKIFVSSTVATSVCQGGTYYTWGLALADFTPAGTTIFTATGTNQKAVYFAQYAGQVGLNHVGTTSGGVGHGRVLNTPANKTKFFQQNGTAALPVIYGWDTSITANPTVEGAVTNGIACQTTAFAGTSPAAYFRLGASQLGYSQTVNTNGAFESVVLINGTTPIPSNFTASPFGVAQTPYYMRDLQLVSGQWYFNLSLTQTGAAVVPATNSATFSMARQGGISTSHSLFKTGNLTPAWTGTILQAHSFGCVVPNAVPALAALNGQDCIFAASSSNLYMGRVSDLTDGGTTWSNSASVNALGTGFDITSPSILFARYSSYLDSWVYVTNTSKFVLKPHQNNFITQVFGALSNLYYEAQNYTSVPVGLATIISLNIGAGWLFITGSTVGQRGVVAADLYADDSYGYSYIISKVMQVLPGSRLRFFTTDESAADFTGDVVYYVRSAPTVSDPLFNSPSGGWSQFDPYTDNFPVSFGPFFQIKVTYSVLVDSKNISPAQLHDVIVVYDEPGEIDEHFAWCNERTSQSGNSPMVVSVRQMMLFSSAPTKFVLEGRDDAGNIVSTIDTAINGSQVAMSNNNGTSYTAWTNMAAFMSSFNSAAGTTELKFTVTSPPAVPFITWSLRYA